KSAKGKRQNMSKQVNSLWHIESSYNIAQQGKPSGKRTAAGDQQEVINHYRGSREQKHEGEAI
ncbi:MAG: hypothetical protein K6G32_15570, partial [Prevotella sp.]|nr:hypothetical protein [Prevotella sp.]